MAENKAPIEHALVRNTVRLQAGPMPDNLNSTGTGFFYQVTHPTTNDAKVLILTNKHVVRNASFVHFVLSTAPSVMDLNEEHQPKGRTDHPTLWPLIGNLIAHPDPEIDLCAIDITIPFGQHLQAGRQLRSMCLTSSWLPSVDDRRNLRDIEQVMVIGYPSGLWDSHNNMPIARRGSTATHALARYAGKQHFLIDVAAFQGSSGSPVFTYESPMFRQPDGSFTPGTKVNFVGIVWGVIERTVTGELQAIEIPSASRQVPVLQSSLNLAIALQADAVLAIDELIFPGITAIRAAQSA
jgi:hypothetical protein